MSDNTPQEIADGFIRNPQFYSQLEYLGKESGCLTKLGVDPDSVIRINENVYQGFKLAAEKDTHNMYSAAPSFFENVLHQTPASDSVPEFGPLTELVILVGIIGSIVIYRKFKFD